MPVDDLTLVIAQFGQEISVIVVEKFVGTALIVETIKIIPKKTRPPVSINLAYIHKIIHQLSLNGSWHKIFYILIPTQETL